MKKIYFLSFLFIASFLPSFSQTYNYNFNGNLNESSTGPALTEVLSCSATAGNFASQLVTTTLGNCNAAAQTVFAFNEGGGLSFPNSNTIGGTYTIHVFFKFNLLSGYQRIIDFLGGSTDVGLYTLNDCLNFYPNGNVGACPYFVANRFYLLTLVRDGATNTITIYINGASFGSYNDASATYVPSTTTTPIVFFRDNIASSAQCEDRDGSIKYLSISPVTSTAGQVNTVWTNICAIALPVTLTSFTASKTATGAALQWKTASETATKNYEVERSANGKDFTAIGTVTATNRATGSSYFYTDAQPLADVNYYRLKMVDNNGGYRYSSTLKLNFSKETGLQLYPNPAHDVVVLSGLKQHNMIRLLTLDGRLLKSFTTDSETATLSLADYPKGTYVVECGDGKNTQRQKLIRY